MQDGFSGRYQILDEPAGRRRWPDETKAAIVRESYAPGARVGEVARRHGVIPSQLTTWRRQVREGRLSVSDGVLGLPDPAEFVPLMLQAVADASPAPGLIEITVGTIGIRLPAATPALRLAEIVAALGRASA